MGWWKHIIEAAKVREDLVELRDDLGKLERRFEKVLGEFSRNLRRTRQLERDLDEADEELEQIRRPVDEE